jgi:hypothetical protein
MTSAGTSTPSRSFAARVARVTPSLIRRCPSLPRMTYKGGIPSSDFPCLAIYRASFPGSAPCARLGGRCRLPGSTSMNSGILSRLALAVPILAATPIELYRFKPITAIVATCHCAQPPRLPEPEMRRSSHLAHRSALRPGFRPGLSVFFSAGNSGSSFPVFDMDPMFALRVDDRDVRRHWAFHGNAYCGPYGNAKRVQVEKDTTWRLLHQVKSP